jgi:hypothetical protein
MSHSAAAVDSSRHCTLPRFGLVARTLGVLVPSFMFLLLCPKRRFVTKLGIRRVRAVVLPVLRVVLTGERAAAAVARVRRAGLVEPSLSSCQHGSWT